eukprot:gene14702-22491_t
MSSALRKLCCCLPCLRDDPSFSGDADDEDVGRSMEDRPLVTRRAKKLGPVELAEKLKEQTVFKDVTIARYISESLEPSAAARDGAAQAGRTSPGLGAAPRKLFGLAPEARKGSNATPPPSSSPSPAFGVRDHLIADYIDSIAADNGATQYTVVISGPMIHQTEDGGDEEDARVVAALDELETLLLDKTDHRRFEVVGVKACDLEIRMPVLSFLNNLLSCGSVESFSLVNCIVSPTTLSAGLHVNRSTTLRHLSFKNCSLTDAHLTEFIGSLRGDGAPLLDALTSFHTTGAFSPEVVQNVLTFFEDEVPSLCSIAFPRRHEQTIKHHSICTTLPNLLLNGKK